MKGRLVYFEYNDTLKFSISLKSKITVIRGRSGLGKTTFITSATNASFDDHDDRVVTWNTANGTTLAEFCSKLKEGDIVCLDEDSVRAAKYGGGLRKLCDLPVYLVLAFRGDLKELTFSYRDIYYIEDTISGSEHTCTLCRKYELHEDFIKADKYVCEDTNSGFQYFADRLDNVTSMEGKKNCLKYNNGETLILDGAAIGSYIDELVRRNVHLFLPVSFEYLVLRKFCTNKTEIMNEWSPKYLTFERFFTDMCCSGKYLPFKYTKRNLHNRVYGVTLIDELNGLPSKRICGVFQKQYCLIDTSKLNCKSQIRECLSDFGYESLFDTVLDLLPDVLEEDSFVGLIAHCISTVTGQDYEVLIIH